MAFGVGVRKAPFQKEFVETGVVAQSWEVREVVAVQKEPQANLVHPIRFGERQALAHETRKPLPQSVVPSLDMRRLSAFLACLRMLLGGMTSRYAFQKSL
jgi:hypothetical protein